MAHFQARTQAEGDGAGAVIKQLYDERSAKGLVFHPPCYVGDEWFVPIGIPAIFIPFFPVCSNRIIRLSISLQFLCIVSGLYLGSVAFVLEQGRV